MAVPPQVWQYRIIVHHLPVYRKSISVLLTRITGLSKSLPLVLFYLIAICSHGFASKNGSRQW